MESKKFDTQATDTQQPTTEHKNQYCSWGTAVHFINRNKILYMPASSAFA